MGVDSMHMWRTVLLMLLLLPAMTLVAEEDSPSIRFRKQVLTEEYYADGITTGDINRDGKLDIVSGPSWYEGPAFTKAHTFCYPARPSPPERSPSNAMFSFVHDFSGDGWPDILVLGRVHVHQAFWYENPADGEGLWQQHLVFERVRGESPTLVDLTGEGKPQLLTHWEGRWGWLEPAANPRRPWHFQPIGENLEWPQFYHGQGVGDINGDGRLDVILNDGWYEQPANPRERLWTLHQHLFSDDRGGAQMFAYDVNDDGRNDVISAVNAHGWGLAWHEQQAAGSGPAFVEHRIMGDREEESQFGVAFSQPHALELADLNNDGLRDIIVGKRMWAHGPRGDVEPAAASVVYWFELQRDQEGSVQYVPHLIDSLSGVGVQICTADVNEDGRVDVLTASKLGAFVFYNEPAPTE
jgi:hypothetical protein